MTVDHYATAARGWADGAELVYRPIARELVASSPHPLTGRSVLDIGAGTGAASAALLDRGARPLAVDLSHSMLAWDSGNRPPAVVGDVLRLPVRRSAVDDVVAAFVYNHLTDPEAAIREAMRVTRPGGAVLACVYSNDNQSDARDTLDGAARDEGWRPPEWYLDWKQTTTPLLGSAVNMATVAAAAGLDDVVVDERPVEVGVTTAQQLVDYRLGQAPYADWLDELGAARAEAVRAQLVTTVTPVMAPYRPIVVFLAGLVPSA